MIKYDFKKIVSIPFAKVPLEASRGIEQNNYF